MLAHLLVALLVQTPSGDTLAIRAGRILDLQTGETESGVTLLIHDGVIVARGRDLVVPPAVPVFDASRYTLLPGLIDAHVHLSLRGRPRDNALTTLHAGFTTVADLGSAGGLGVRIQKLVELDSVPGPKIVTAGSWIGARGGVCEFGGATIRGGVEAAARAAADVAARVNMLKVCVTAWLPTAIAAPDSVEMTTDELRAVMQTANAARIPVAAHAIGSAGVQFALREGIRLFAHTPVVDSTMAAALRRENACVIATMASLLPADANEALRRSFSLLRRAGVTFAFGTDAGAVAHGAQSVELTTLVDLGMTPLEALRTASVNAAACLRLPPYGAVNVGAVADLIAIEGDPLANVAAVAAPVLVFRGGRLVHDRRGRDN